MNTIRQGDCIEQMNALEAGSANLVFADPPFNIGYEYDVYRDKLGREKYLDWSREWMGAVHRLLADNGTFWLAIGDEYAAELKIEAQQLGFHCRSWVIWYYTFGVNCKRKFTRSHAHLFHFVKDPDNFVFRAEALENRIPSARQLVYNDSRANPDGRLPDDTWIIRPADAAGEMDDEEYVTIDAPPQRDDQQTWTLRPQDIQDCFSTEEDTWYFPRVAGTFKERAGFHGCQMPEQLLGRIIRICSEEGGLVVDPFSGSGTTVAVAKKLGRRYLAFDLSEQYVTQGSQRLDVIRVGDPLVGSPEPTMSAPKTSSDRLDRSSARLVRASRAKRKDERSSGKERGAAVRNWDSSVLAANAEAVDIDRQIRLTNDGLIAAFAATHDGFSADRVIADPLLNENFIAACTANGLIGTPRIWNTLLFRLRKAGRLADIPTQKRTTFEWTECDPFLFASEIAWRTLLDEEMAESLDEILCDPQIAEEFDRTASRLAPGFQPLEYRWAALKIRKQSKIARVRSEEYPKLRFGKSVVLDEFDESIVPEGAGVYMIGDPRTTKKQLYGGEAINLRGRLSRQFDGPLRELWHEYADSRGIEPARLQLRFRRTEADASQMMSWQSRLVRQFKPILNLCNEVR